MRVTNGSHWADGRWANLMRFRSTDRNASLCSLFADKNSEHQINHVINI